VGQDVGPMRLLSIAHPTWGCWGWGGGLKGVLARGERMRVKQCAKYSCTMH
jgi:hypothetical protein